MSLHHILIRMFARRQRQNILKMARNAVTDQDKILQRLVRKGRRTKFGQEHGFDNIRQHAHFSKQVPPRDYEDLRPYIDAIIEGDNNVLWPGRPKYFAKTSGTTSGVKYIPISSVSIGHHIRTARNAILNYVALTGADIFTKKMIFLSGSPEMELKSGIPTGRLSGIVNHEVPAWVRPNQLPSYGTNCIEDWEEKLDRIVAETRDQDMSLISGIPPWVQMYFERLLRQSKATSIKELFPHFRLFVHGGVNYQPYAGMMNSLMGSGVDTLETYPASEGFIAFQDSLDHEGLLLNTNAGMFFEFVPLDAVGQPNPPRLGLSEVDTGIDYALLITSDAGLWAYNIGDTIRFVSTSPYRIVVSGRVSHYISAFGEHVISKEVEEAMASVSRRYDVTINEFTVAPQMNDADGGPPYHQWLVEFEIPPDNLDRIEADLDAAMCDQNIYYRDLIEGGILRTLRVVPVPRGSFRRYMKSLGKLGGQNKVPRLTNDRKIATILLNNNN